MTGPEEALDLYERHVNPGLASVFRFMGLLSYEAWSEGVWIWDADGKRYLDFSSGYGVMVHGYRHPKLVRAARDQLDRLTLSSRVILSKEAAELAARLAEVTPGDLSVSFFSNSGTEAVEAALKFARIATGRTRIVATFGAFHGKTMGALSLSGKPLYQDPFVPLLPDVAHVPYGDAGAAREAIDDATAAFIAEPIQGEGGIIVPPDGYLSDLREITRKKGALLILDEVQTGMGRTGHLWASEHEGVAPDLMCAAKGLGGGIVPIGATIGTPEVMRFLESAPLIHTSTFGGNPLACRVALAALDVALEEDLPGRARRLGERLLTFGEEIRRRYPEVIRGIRGRGLFAGVELASEGMGGALMYELISRGLLAVYTLNNPFVIRLMPPLVISEDDLEDGLSRIEEAVKAVWALREELV